MFNYLTNKNLWIAIFYIMSPYFPGNNFLELALIGSFVGIIAPFLPTNWDLGLVRVILYIIYNVIAVLGLYLLQKNQHFFTIQNFIEILIVIFVLFVSGYIPEPIGTIFLVIIGIYFIFKNQTYKIMMESIKKICIKLKLKEKRKNDKKL